MIRKKITLASCSNLLIAILGSLFWELEGVAQDSVIPERIKPRTVVMLDPELDDSNTLVRYLLYSNEFKTEGFVYTSSQFHWRGNGTPYTGEGMSSHLRFPGIESPTSWRWDEDTRFIEDALEIYTEVYPRFQSQKTLTVDQWSDNYRSGYFYMHPGAYQVYASRGISR